MSEPKVGFSPLEALPVAIDRADIERAYQPFLAEFDAAAFDGDVARRKRKAFIRLIKHKLGLKPRDTDAIKAEYHEAWSARHARYDISRGAERPAAWVWGDQKLWIDTIAAARMRAPMLAAVIRALKPKRVLEVGSGNGINLLLLAGAFPDVEFTGLELTDAGIAAARAVQAAGDLPQQLADYSPLTTEDPRAHQKINFVQGSAADLPFDDGEFDLVYTVLAVEQMERIRHQALSEIARVSRGYVLNLEPFRDANDTGVRNLYASSRNYFRGAIDELPQYGLEPQWATVDFPQEVFLGSPLVLSKKVK